MTRDDGGENYRLNTGLRALARESDDDRAGRQHRTKHLRTSFVPLSPEERAAHEARVMDALSRPTPSTSRETKPTPADEREVARQVKRVRVVRICCFVCGQTDTVVSGVTGIECDRCGHEFRLNYREGKLYSVGDWWTPDIELSPRYVEWPP